MLHNEKELFEQVILRTADALRIEPGIIEKDYFVTMFLKKLAAKQPDIVFKGGTSLSKCHRLIHRFSEDIDLNLQGDTKPPESVRRKLRDSIYSAIDELELSLEKPILRYGTILVVTASNKKDIISSDNTYIDGI